MSAFLYETQYKLCFTKINTDQESDKHPTTKKELKWTQASAHTLGPQIFNFSSKIIIIKLKTDTTKPVLIIDNCYLYK